MRVSLLSFLSLAAVASATKTEEGQLKVPSDPWYVSDNPRVVAMSEARGRQFLNHYGPPPDGCEKDEKSFQIQGIPGGICAPMCTDFLPCPKDTPDGVTAVPQCALEDQDGKHYCVLLCQVGSDDSNLRGGVVGDAQCGKATCQEVPGQGGVGVCTYG